MGDNPDNVSLAAELWRAQRHFDELVFEFEEITGICYEGFQNTSATLLLEELRKARP